MLHAVKQVVDFIIHSTDKRNIALVKIQRMPGSRNSRNGHLIQPAGIDSKRHIINSLDIFFFKFQISLLVK